MILEKSEDLKFGFFILREDLKFGGPSDPTETLYQSKDFSPVIPQKLCTKANILAEPGGRSYMPLLAVPTINAAYPRWLRARPMQVPLTASYT
jgi:hypothetical protein